MIESRHTPFIESGPLRTTTGGDVPKRGTVLAHVRPDAHFDMMRRETIQSLLDPTAKWPDGTPREIGVPLYERMRQKAAERAAP